MHVSLLPEAETQPKLRDSWSANAVFLLVVFQSLIPLGFLWRTIEFQNNSPFPSSKKIFRLFGTTQILLQPSSCQKHD